MKIAIAPAAVAEAMRARQTIDGYGVPRDSNNPPWMSER